MFAFKPLISVILLLVAPSALAATFTFTAIPDEDESQLRTRFDKVAVYWKRNLGWKLNISL